MRVSAPLLLIGFVVVAAACSRGGGGGAMPTPTPTPTTTPTPPPVRRVFTILLANQDFDEVVGSANAPYLNTLIATDGVLATAYRDVSHPDLPNTLMMVSGAVPYPGFINEGPQQGPAFPSKGTPNLGDQLTAAGIPWRAYEEGMGSACNLASSGNYATFLNPFVYFDTVQNGPGAFCASVDVDYGSFAADLAAGTYRYSWIAPDLTHDGHDTGNPTAALAASDLWLSNEVPKILNSAVYQSSGALFITWDQAEGRNGDDPDQVAMLVLSPALARVGTNDGAVLTHASYLATVEDIFGLPRLAAAGTAGSMTTLFSH